MRGFFEKVDFIFGTRVMQKVEYCDSNLAEIQNKVNKATEIMRAYEAKLSFFNEASEVSKINNYAGKGFVKVSSDTFNILKKAQYYSEITNGLFDITIAPLMKEWGINSNEPYFLEESKVREILPLVNYDNVILNDKNLSVMLLKKNQKIDLGGIAKGYIADRIIEFYKENNIMSAIINIGGNIKVLGEKDDGALWNIGILKPQKHSTNSICSVEIKDKSIVTSGGYERAFMYNGQIFHHILNPKTGYPSKTDLISVTIVGNESVDADGLSTSLFIMGKDKAYKFLKKYNISAILVTNNHQIIITKDLFNSFNLFENYIVLAF